MIVFALFRGFAAAHMDPIVFLILLGVSFLFRVLSGKKQKPDSSDRTTPPAPRQEFPRREIEGSDQERIRKFLEALGQPQSAQPPPPVIPRPVVDSPEPQREERARTVRPRSSVLNPLPPLTTQPPPLPRRVRLPGQMTQPPYQPKTFVPPPPMVPAFEVHQDEGPPETSEPKPVTSAADAYAIATAPPLVVGKPSQFLIDLRAPGELRRAILLREILGPPRSLAPLEVG